MEDSSIEALFRQNNEFIRDLRYWLDRGLSYNDAFSKAKIPTLRIVPNSAEPYITPVQSEVGSLGFATGIPHKQGILSDIGILSPQKVDRPHVADTSSTQRSIQDCADKEIDWLRIIGCGGCTLICTSALISFGIQAGGNSLESVFWSSLIVISSSILLALPFHWWLPRSWIQKVLGLALIGIGYMTMHASIESTEQRSVGISAASSTGVQQMEKRIADLEQRLKPTRDAIARLDAVEDYKKITRMQSGAEPLEDELAAARKELVNAQDKATTHVSAGLASSWSWVELLRRLALEPLNILCLHGFIEAWPNLMNALRKRRIRLAQLTT